MTIQQTNSIKSDYGAFILCLWMLESISVCVIWLVPHVQYVIWIYWIFISNLNIACVSELKAPYMLGVLTGHLIVLFFLTGSTVKNLPAFHLLQSSLLRSQDSLLCCQLLRTLQTIWETDPTNFFLLEWTVQSMTQLAACVWQKPALVQKQFFSLLEMVWLLMLLHLYHSIQTFSTNPY